MKHQAGSERQPLILTLSGLHAATFPKAKDGILSNFGLTISGFLPQMSIRRMRTTAEGNSIRVMAMKLVVSSGERFEIMFMFRQVRVLPDVGVLSEVDLVSTERRGSKEGEKHAELPT